MIEITRALARQLRNVFRKLAPRAVAMHQQISCQTGKEGLSVRLHGTDILAQFHQAW